jgi:hypothetical protein
MIGCGFNVLVMSQVVTYLAWEKLGQPMNQLHKGREKSVGQVPYTLGHWEVREGLTVPSSTERQPRSCVMFMGTNLVLCFQFSLST